MAASTRRSFLRSVSVALGVGLSGCADRSDSNRGETESASTRRPTAGSQIATAPPSVTTRTARASTTDATSTPRSTPCGTPLDDAATTEADRFSAAIATDGTEDVSLSAGISRPSTEDHPAALGVSFRHDRNEPTTYQSGHNIPFSGAEVRHTERDASLLLGPWDNHEVSIDYRRTDGCWRAEPWGVVPDYFQAVTLDPCESVRWQFDLVAPRESEQCVPPGRYTRSDTLDNRDTGESFSIVLTVTVA